MDETVVTPYNFYILEATGFDKMALRYHVAVKEDKDHLKELLA